MAAESVANPVADLTDEDWNAMDDKTYEANLEKLIDTAPALLSFEEMDQIEKWWCEGIRRRRCSLVLLTMPAKELTEKVHSDRDFAIAVADVLDGIKDVVNVSEELTQLFRAVEARTILALSVREDMQEIVEAAKQLEVTEAGDEERRAKLA